MDRFATCVIGHEDNCQIHIDSLAVSAYHAKITFENQSYYIETIDDESNMLINNRNIIGKIALSDGDEIILGKHKLIFNFDERSDKRDQQSILAPPIFDIGIGWVQYINGVNMGKTIQIKNSMTTVNNDDESIIAMVSNRADGFYISHLKGEQLTQVKDLEIGDQSSLLMTNSHITLGKQELLFYIT